MINILNVYCGTYFNNNNYNFLILLLLYYFSAHLYRTDQAT